MSAKVVKKFHFSLFILHFSLFILHFSFLSVPLRDDSKESLFRALHSRREAQKPHPRS